jgi:hypothetical protein
MTLMTYASWMLGPILQITLLIFMVRRKLRTTFPLFFSYVLFQVLKSGCLALFFRFDQMDYFYAYWTGNAISVFLGLTVMDEIWRQLFGPYEGIQRLGSLIFRWACVVLFLAALVIATSTQRNSADRIIAAVFTFDRTMRLVQCGLVFLVVIVSRFLKSFWRQQVFGIALGFGIFASIELILVSLLSRYGASHINSISLTKSIAYNAVTILWIGYVRLAVPATANKLVGDPQLELLNQAILGIPDTAEDYTFLTRVEEAVERVLARSAEQKRKSA